MAQTTAGSIAGSISPRVGGGSRIGWTEMPPHTSPGRFGSINIGVLPSAPCGLSLQASLCNCKSCLRQNARCQTEAVRNHQVSGRSGRGLGACGRDRWRGLRQRAFIGTDLLWDWGNLSTSLGQPACPCPPHYGGGARRGSELAEGHSAPLLGQWRERLWKN